MSRRDLLLILGGIALLAVALVLFMPKPTRQLNWSDTLRPTGKQPYDTYALYELLSAERPVISMEDSPVWLLPSEDSSQSTYLLLHHATYMNEEEASHLLQFVAQGNTALLLTNELSAELSGQLDSLYQLDGVPVATTINVGIRTNFIPAPLRADTLFHFVHYNEYQPSWRWWHYWPRSEPLDRSTQPLALFEGDTAIHFLRLPVGAGFVYWHLNPTLFTNFYLREAYGRTYAEGVLSALGPGAVYWDDYTHNDRHYQSPQQARNPLRVDHSMHYLLAQPALAWAWYLGWLLALCYLLLRAKRRQRVIPVIQPLVNTSQQYVGTVARLHYLQGNHLQLAQREAKLFKHFVRERYRLAWSEDHTALAADLAARSGLPLPRIQEALTQLRLVQHASQLEVGSLVRFHRALRVIYAAGEGKKAD